MKHQVIYYIGAILIGMSLAAFGVYPFQQPLIFFPIMILFCILWHILIFHKKT